MEENKNITQEAYALLRSYLRTTHEYFVGHETRQLWNWSSFLFTPFFWLQFTAAHVPNDQLIISGNSMMGQ